MEDLQEYDTFSTHIKKTPTVNSRTARNMLVAQRNTVFSEMQMMKANALGNVDRLLKDAPKVSHEFQRALNLPSMTS